MDTLLDNAPCGFLAFGDDGVVQLVNRTLLELLGYDRDDVVGRHIEQLFTVGTRIFYQTHWFPLLRLHGHAQEVFLMMRTRGGESMGLLSYARRRVGGDLYDCIFVPVKERAKYEDELLRARRTAEAAAADLEVQKQELMRANEQLETQAVELEMQQEQLRDQADQLQKMAALADDANQAKSTFLATMSHELRTPLNAIGGYLQILDLGIAGPLNDQQKDILARLERSSRHLLHLINDVLDLSRIEAGHVTYDLQEVHVAESVSMITPLVEPQLAAKRLSFHVHVDDELMVRADAEKLSQILINLLGNAVKFTPEGGRIDLRARRDEDHGVQILVKDTGIGIAPHQLEAIFQPFVQADGARTRDAQGSGLGLAISRDLARGMGGELGVISTPGKGSTFILRLPVP
jgi:PAS domain S-box-containing protein